MAPDSFERLVRAVGRLLPNAVRRRYAAKFALAFLVVAAVVVAVIAATIGMSLLRARHAPAYATVLIFTLGIPGRAIDVLVFCGGVCFLLCLDVARTRLVAA